MKKIFQQFINQFSAFTKISVTKDTSAIEIQNPKTKTETKAYTRMPRAFDFTAYFDDNELENNAEDISNVNPVVETNTEVFCMNDEKCNEMLYSSNSQQFECCTN